MAINRSNVLTCLEFAKQCCFEPDRTLHKDESVSKDFLVAELDDDVRECLV